MEKDIDIIKLASDELIKGAKMLSTHCSKCGCPLFEKDNKIYCPICEKLKNKNDNNDDNTNDELKENNIYLVNIEDILNEKINYLTNRLKDEKEVNRIREISEALYLLIKIKKKIK